MSKIIPVITLYQPWASWVMFGMKPIETRTHERFKCLIGKRIGIHAGKRDKSEYTKTLYNPYIKSKDLKDASLMPAGGYFLGTVLVESGSKLSFEHSQKAMIECGGGNRYGLFLTDPLIYDPVPVKGSMGIWYFDLEKKEKVKKPASQNLFTDSKCMECGTPVHPSSGGLCGECAVEDDCGF